jgi:hypothetical protein
MGTFVPDPGSQSRRPVAWNAAGAGAPLTRTEVEAALDRKAASGPRRRGKLDDRLAACLLYPLQDGPGVALLVVFPPFLWVMSIPVFDLVAALRPRGEFNSLALLIVPFTLPLVFTFAIALGYAVLFLAEVLAVSALGEDEHPPWPALDPDRMGEGFARVLWAAVMGICLGVGPAFIFWNWFGGLEAETWAWAVSGLLLALGVGYGQMAVAAALLHDSPWGANPINVTQAIALMGARLFSCWAVTIIALAAAAVALGMVLFDSSSMHMAAIGLWGFWVLAFYGAMVSARMLGLAYARSAATLHWFRSPPRWTNPGRCGRIYSNT